MFVCKNYPIEGKHTSWSMWFKGKQTGNEEEFLFLLYSYLIQPFSAHLEHCRQKRETANPTTD